MPYKTIYVDIDSTIWHMEDWTKEAAKELFGVVVPEITTWETIPNLVGPEWFRVYEAALKPERIPDRPVYPGAQDALTALFYDNYNLHFISHNPKPKQMYDPVLNWLMELLPDVEHFSFTLYGARNDKVDTMNEDPTAWGIIEDKPSTLRKAVQAKYNTLAKLHPYNRLTVQQYPAIIGFDDWVKVPDLVAEREGVLV